MDENIIIRKYQSKDIGKMVDIWNEVVEEGVLFRRRIIWMRF